MALGGNDRDAAALDRNVGDEWIADDEKSRFGRESSGCGPDPSARRSAQAILEGVLVEVVLAGVAQRDHGRTFGRAAVGLPRRAAIDHHGRAGRLLHLDRPFHQHCGSSNTQAGQGSSGASSIVDVPGRAACDMKAMIVGRVHGRESIRLRGARFFFKRILAECT